MEDLKQLFYDYVTARVGSDGFPCMCLHRDADGHFVYSHLDLPYPKILKLTIELRMKGATEIIFGVDRQTREGQGTLYDDVYTCAYWKVTDSEKDPFVGQWEIGIINYKPPTMMGEMVIGEAVVEEFDWDNEFWFHQMGQEISESDWEIKSLVEVIAEKQAIKTNVREDRPDDIQDFELSEWEAGFEDWCKSNDPPPVDTEKGREFFLELYISGQWLKRELDKICDDEVLINGQCSVAGQRTFLSKPWAAARKVLDNFKNGVIETPGFELAEVIIRENVAAGKIAFNRDKGTVSFRAEENG